MLKKFLSVCAASVMGLCLFCGCGKDNSSELKEEEKSDMIVLRTWFPTSGVPNNVIEVKGEEDSIFEISATKGEFWDSSTRTYKQIVQVKSSKSVRWQFDTPESTYIDVTEWLNDNVIGYGIIEVTFNENPSGDYEASVIKSVRFSKNGGKYPKVTKNQVKALIDKCKG